MVAYLNYRLGVLKEALFSSPQSSSNRKKTAYIGSINAYEEILNLVSIFKDDIARREKEKEMMDHRAKEAGVGTDMQIAGIASRRVPKY
jgi:hypothetical protein